jgi:acyl-CoA thioesterase I
MSYNRRKPTVPAENRGRVECFEIEEIRMTRKALYCFFALFVFMFLSFGLEAAHAGDGIVVALGASNTYGKMVARGEDYPAQLELLLHAKRINVSVENAGVNGDTTYGMLQRIDGATPEGTKLVIFEPCCNDFTLGLGSGHAGNVSEIKRRLAARHISLIFLHFKDYRVESELVDGVHFTAAGYRRVAEALLPQVIKALRRK